jgi:hypothetical protein
VSLPQLGDLLQSCRESGQFATPTQSLDCLELIVCGPARADEIRVVCVREAIGARASGGHDRALFEEQDGPAGAGKREGVRDRFDSLCVRDGVSAAIEDAEAYAFLVCDAREEVSALGARTADLEVRGTRTAEGAPAE